MDDPDGGLNFDFEGGLDAGAPVAPSGGAAALIQSEAPGSAGAVGVPGAPGDPAVAMVGGGAGRRSFRQTVCRHWLRSLCMKGDACGFLHQYDKSRMPVCRFYRLYGECREQDCVYKHTNEDIKECNMGTFPLKITLKSVHMEGAAEPISAHQNPQVFHSDKPGPSHSATNNNSPLVAKLHKFLFRRMLVGVNDGRFFIGVFHCIDKQGNIILQDAVEYRNTRRSATSPMDQRCLGLILIPASCRSSCHVDCSIEEQLSMVSLQE